MAGVLNNKTRMLDTILTLEGRRQIASGDLRIKYVTFTDRHTFYSQEDINDVADNADNRIFLESFHRPQDRIIFETDDEGRILPFAGSDIKILNEKLFREFGGKKIQITGDRASAATYELLNSVAKNFADQQIIGTKDIYSDTNGFSIYPKNITFEINDDNPFKKNEISEMDLEIIESLFQDKRLQHLPFYKYLPPINKTEAGFTSGTPLGYYKRLNQDAPMSFNDIKDSLSGKQVHTIEYLETSNENNVVLQILETKSGGIQKLALIDCGEFELEDESNKHVYFVGKIFKDRNNMQTFVNMFTVVFE